MAVSVVEVGVKALGSGGSQVVALASAPTTGDYVVLVATCNGTRTLNTVSGCGTTSGQWTIAHDVSATVSMSFAWTSAANASGNLTAAFSASRTGVLRAYVVRGLTGTPTIAASSNTATGTGSVSSPSDSVTLGDIVISAFVDNGTAAETTWTRTSYTDDPTGVESNGTNNTTASAYRIPGSSVTTSTSAQTSVSRTVRVGQISLKSASSTPQTVSAPALAVVADTLNPTVTPGTRITVAASLAALALAVPAPVIHAGTGVTVAAPVLAVAVDATSPTVTAGTAVTVVAPVLGVVEAMPAPTVIVASGIVVLPPALALTDAVPAPTVTAGAARTVTAPALAVAVDVLDPTVTAGVGASGTIALDVSVDLQILSQESQSPVVESDGTIFLDATVDLVVRHQLAPASPPLGVLTEWPVKRLAHLMPALSAANPRRQGVLNLAGSDPYLYRIESGDVGRFHTFVDGVDVTYLRDSPLKFNDVTNSVQVGPLSASLTVPQMRPWDTPGEGDLSVFDMTNDPRIEVLFVREDDSVEQVFEGALATDEDSSGPGREDYTFHAEGALMQAAHELTEVPLFQEPIDPGWLIADIMNSVTHRRYMKFRRFTTGMPEVIDRGQQGQSKWQRVLDLLTRCIDDDGRQLAIVRVGPWDFQMAWKQDTTAADWTVTKGAPRVEVALRVDQSTRRDCIYGRGVDPEGGVWGNYFFVGLDFFLPPLYPMAGFANITVGTTDADTTTGSGVTLVERRMRDLGYRVTIDGVWTSSDNAWVDDIQRKRGITVDSSLGPQTWSAIFERPADSVFDVVRLPLAGVPEVEPLLYNANGSVAGVNPADNPEKIRHAMPEVDFGNNIWKRDAAKLAQKMLERDAVPAHVGTITLTSDPWEEGSSRFDIRVGDNVQVLGHRGDVIVQVAEVSRDDVTVTLTVDSKARDALALDAILERDRDARRDPTGRTARTTDMSSLNKSEVVQYESESRAGFYPRTAINGDSGLWTVLPMFVSQVGVAKVEFYAESPKAEMVVALFEKPITANRLASYIADPLSSKEGWYDNVQVLEDSHGMTEIFGTPESPFGYWPRQKGQAGATLTGVGKDRASTLYSSKYGGVMWVAVFTSRSTWVHGRCFPANGR